MSNYKDDLGDRMKSYESIYSRKLFGNLPVFIRLDGKNFSNFTKGLQRPFDEELQSIMNKTMMFLVENIQGCKFAINHSDEISLILLEDNPGSQMWFDGNISKMETISSSMATYAFNKFLSESNLPDKNKQKMAIFDSRARNLPNMTEVVNYLIWRQFDARRNSISACAQANFSPKQLHKVDSLKMLEMLNQIGFNWESLPNDKKWIRSCYKVKTEIETPNGKAIRNKWQLDLNTPFIVENKTFVLEKFIKESE